MSFFARPSPADPEGVAHAAEQSQIAKALKDALTSLTSSSEILSEEPPSEKRKNTDETNINDDVDDKKVSADVDQAQNNSEGSKVNEAKCQNASSDSLVFTKDMADTIHSSFCNAVVQSDWTQAPSVIMRGRIDHYNRVGDKWRICVTGAELRPRVPIKAARIRKHRPSLWEASKKAHPDKVLSIEGNLVVLAYDDLI